MFRPNKIGLLLLGLSMGCVLPQSRGQDGPIVQVFTRDSPGNGTQTVAPLWRLPVRVSVSVSAGYDENVDTLSSGSQGSAFTSASIGLDYNFGTSRTRATLRTGTSVTYNPDASDNRYDPNIFLDLSVTHQASLRLTLTGAVNANYRSEPDFRNDFGVNRRAGNYFSFGSNFSANYQWLPRFSTSTTYSPGSIQYDSAAVATENRFDQDFGQSFRFLFLPVTNLVADFRLSLASYDSAGRGSTSYAVLAGIDHTILPGFQGTIRAGAGFRSTVQTGDGSEEGVSPHVETSLSYQVGGRTSLGWTTSYATEESSIPTSPGSLTFRTGLQLTYALTKRITFSLGGNYEHSENEAGGFIIPGTTFFFVQNPASSEDALSFSASASYLINRHFSANIGFDHSEVDSDTSTRGYSRNRYSSGLTLNF